MTFSPVKLRAAAILGLAAVALGAFGAHGLKSHWEATLTAAEAAYRLDIWKTGILYHLAHAIVLLVLAFGCPAKHEARIASWCFVIGVNIFSGTLYMLALTGMKWMGAITPLGGLFLMLGWLLLACQRSNLADTRIAKCDLCEKEARVFATHIADGEMTQMKFCEKCAKEKGELEPTGFRLTPPPPA